MKRLSVSDFRIHSGLFFNWAILNIREPHMNSWVFNIKKSTVFKELNWERDSEITSQLDISETAPMFRSYDECMMFLIVSITLHNETMSE